MEQTTLLGYFRYRKNDIERVAVTVLANQIDKSRGDGYYTKTFYCDPSIIPSGLKAGKVNVKTNAWNSNQLEEIANI